MARTHLLMISVAACALSLGGLLINGLPELPAMWGLAFAKHAEPSDSQMPLKEQETIHKSFSFNTAGGRSRLEVDNVFGSIEVVATKSDQAKLVIAKTIRAESQERLEAARREVTLDISQHGNDLRLYVNGPFRCHCSGDCVGIREDQ